MTDKILDAGDRDLIDAFFRLFREAFSEATREPDEQIWAELRGTYRLPMRVRLWMDADEVVGLARYTYLSSVDTIWLVHLAVDLNRRGAGLGTEMLREVIGSSDVPVIAEVDPGTRVQAWYERFGFETISSTYSQPALHMHTDPVSLHLMSSRTIPDTAEFIKAFYAEAWAIQAASPLVAAALKSVQPNASRSRNPLSGIL